MYYEEEREVATVLDTNVLMDLGESLKDRSNVFIPRVVLEEVGFNYCVAKMLKHNAKKIFFIRDVVNAGSIGGVEIQNLEKESTNRIRATFKTYSFRWHETEMDRLLSDIEMEREKNGKSERFYQILAKIRNLNQMQEHRKAEKRVEKQRAQSEQEQESEGEKREKKMKELDHVFLDWSLQFYPQLLDLINTGKWQLIFSKGTGLTGLIHKIIADFYQQMTGKKKAGIGVGFNDIRVLASAIVLAIERSTAVKVITNDGRLTRNWIFFKDEIFGAVYRASGERIHIQISSTV